MSKGFYFLKALERSRKVSSNIPVNMGSLARHETLVLGVRLRPPKNFLNFRQYFRTPSSTLQKLSTGFHKTSLTMWTTSCIFENLNEMCTKGHTRTSCPPYYCPLCTFEKNWANLCERLRSFSEWRSKKSMAKTGKGSRNERNQRRSITRLGGKLIMLRRMRCHAHH